MDVKPSDAGIKPGRCLHLGNIPIGMNEANLRLQCEFFGEVEALRLVDQKGRRRYAFVTFKNLDSAKGCREAMVPEKGSQLVASYARYESLDNLRKAVPRSGKVISAQGSVMSNKNGKSNRNLTPSRHLWIGNIGPSINPQELRNLCQRYGHIEDVHIIADKNCAFVDFISMEAAENAFSSLRGCVFHDRHLEFGFGNALKRPERHQQQQQQQHQHMNTLNNRMGGVNLNHHVPHMQQSFPTPSYNAYGEYSAPTMMTPGVVGSTHHNHTNAHQPHQSHHHNMMYMQQPQQQPYMRAPPQQISTSISPSRETMSRDPHSIHDYSRYTDHARGISPAAASVGEQSPLLRRVRRGSNSQMSVNTTHSSIPFQSTNDELFPLGSRSHHSKSVIDSTELKSDIDYILNSLNVNSFEELNKLAQVSELPKKASDTNSISTRTSELDSGNPLKPPTDPFAGLFSIRRTTSMPDGHISNGWRKKFAEMGQF
eukprot:TRINITY_DN275_c4_g1_i2.p1 TRINITY_DN275_c4_g1~~TRINITY_DN275_c4_g1_i2.p1  ORF type:complete len:484 (-),score=149.64 TRINITY_DN275_c4_g1_i2:430-1881(-)